MMQQYLQIHDEYPDCLLLFRLGDFSCRAISR